MFGGNVQGEAMNLALTSRAADLPADDMQWRGHQEASYSFYSFLFNDNTALWVRTYKIEVIDHLNEITTMVNQKYPNLTQRRLVYATITFFIHLILQQEFGQRLNAPTPLPGQAIPDRPPPPFADIRQFLLYGRMSSLTSLPEGLTRMITGGLNIGIGPPGPTLGNEGGAAANTAPIDQRDAVPAPRGGGQGDQSQRTQVERPGQNPELKAAWAATGHPSIFGQGSPFRDETQRGCKCVIIKPGSNPPKRLCLAMALRGICYSNCGGFHGPLTQDEVRLVARKGNLTVSGL